MVFLYYVESQGQEGGNATQETCIFYKVKVTTLQNQTTSSQRNLRHPHISCKGYYAHPKSKRPRNIISPSVLCDGDLEKCVISAEYWRSP